MFLLDTICDRLTKEYLDKVIGFLERHEKLGSGVWSCPPPPFLLKYMIFEDGLAPLNGPMAFYSSFPGYRAWVCKIPLA